MGIDAARVRKQRQEDLNLRSGKSRIGLLRISSPLQAAVDFFKYTSPVFVVVRAPVVAGRKGTNGGCLGRPLPIVPDH